MNFPRMCRLILQNKNAVLNHLEFSQRVFYCTASRTKFASGPGLKDFISQHSVPNYVPPDELIPYIDPDSVKGYNRKVFLEVYGCQMNVNDTEIVWSILQSNGFSKTNDANDADIILMMTCAIRENAENKIWHKLKHYRYLKQRARLLKQPRDIKVGVLGCMAERLKERLVERERSVDLVAGPDSYRDLPRLLALTDPHQPAINVLLSQDETYADITPVRLNQDSKTAFVSIMRGCDNMCTYCIVPWTRGRERSRPLDSIVREVEHLSQLGVKEVTLLGQNVNSYRDLSGGKGSGEMTVMAPGFKTVYKAKAGGRRFAELLDAVAAVDPSMRIRFTSPHPKDFPQQVLDVMSSHSNICKSLHMPAQSGSLRVLERMRRGYSPAAYLELVERVRQSLPGVTLSSDFICGFCGETEDDFQQTLDLMSAVRYNVAYLFAYSMREKTTAHRRYADDVPAEVKQERLVRMFTLYRETAAEINKQFIGSHQTILVEGTSKRSKSHLQGRTDGNIKVIIAAEEVPISEGSQEQASIAVGDYVNVKITDSSSQVLKGVPQFKTSLPS